MVEQHGVEMKGSSARCLTLYTRQITEECGGWRMCPDSAVKCC